MKALSASLMTKPECLVSIPQMISIELTYAFSSGAFDMGIRFLSFVKVIDVNPYAVKGGFTDTTLVDKFEMDESEYDKRTDSVRDFKRRHKIGRFADSKMEVTGTDVTEEEKVDPAIVSGVRCEVSADGFQRRGTVRFVGPIEELKAGVWAGVEYDEPLGKNDGKYVSASFYYFGTVH